MKPHWQAWGMCPFGRNHWYSPERDGVGPQGKLLLLIKNNLTDNFRAWFVLWVYAQHSWEPNGASFLGIVHLNRAPDDFVCEQSPRHQGWVHLPRSRQSFLISHLFPYFYGNCEMGGLFLCGPCCFYLAPLWSYSAKVEFGLQLNSRGE